MSLRPSRSVLHTRRPVPTCVMTRSTRVRVGSGRGRRCFLVRIWAQGGTWFFAARGHRGPVGSPMFACAAALGLQRSRPKGLILENGARLLSRTRVTHFSRLRGRPSEGQRQVALGPESQRPHGAVTDGGCSCCGRRPASPPSTGGCASARSKGGGRPTGARRSEWRPPSWSHSDDLGCPPFASHTLITAARPSAACFAVGEMEPLVWASSQLDIRSGLARKMAADRKNTWLSSLREA